MPGLLIPAHDTPYVGGSPPGCIFVDANGIQELVPDVVWETVGGFERACIGDNTGELTGSWLVRTNRLLVASRRTDASSALIDVLVHTEQLVGTTGSMQCLEGWGVTSNPFGSTVALMIGVIGTTQHDGAGNVTQIRSSDGLCWLSGTGSVTTWIAHNSLFVRTGSGTIDTAYHFYAGAMPAGITNKRGVWILGTDTANYFAGMLGAGVIPTRTFEVKDGTHGYTWKDASDVERFHFWRNGIGSQYIDFFESLTLIRSYDAGGSEYPLAFGVNTEKTRITGTGLRDSVHRHQEAEVSYAPTGTSQLINWRSGNRQTLNLASASGDVTLTFTAPDGPTFCRLRIIQGATARDINWPVTIRWDDDTGEPTWNVDTSKTRVVVLDYNGTDYLAQVTPTWS